MSISEAVTEWTYGGKGCGLGVTISVANDDAGLSGRIGKGLVARLGDRLLVGVPGMRRLDAGVFVLEFQIPGTSMPLSRALAPNGVLSSLSTRHNPASSSFWRASSIAYLRTLHLL